MKRVICIFLTLILFIPFLIKAEEKNINMYLFYGENCPHCIELKSFLKEYLEEKDNITLYSYEIWNNNVNKTHLQNIVNILHVQFSGVPYLVIGNSAITGFSKELTPERIKTTVNYYENIIYEDKVGVYLGLIEKSDLKTDEERLDVITIPNNIKNIVNKSPLFISALAIGLIDGFNPCAMWILLFLISMLLGMKNNTRKWTLGIVFILTSGLIYFLFLISVLNLVSFLDKIPIIRAVISLSAVILGFVSVIKFVDSLNSDIGCEVVDSKKRKKII